MIGICYSELDEAGKNMALHLVERYDFEETDGQGSVSYENDVAKMCKVESPLIEADFLDKMHFKLVLFLSMHKSAAGVGLFSTHSLGNWSADARLGGKGKELSFAAPVVMLAALSNLSKIESQVGKRYEATHHGPLLKTPSLFVEIGGNDDVMKSKEYAIAASEAAYEAVLSSEENDVKYKKIVIGIGSNHYPANFSALAMEKGYAFSHIMPKYAINNADGSNNLDVLEQALKRSTPEPEAAVIDWKSLNAATREETIKTLDEIGLDYETI
jgi:D-aminoacyl-tRNA deacylase